MACSVVILGAGVGGLVVANRLRKKLPKGDRVVLVDREGSFVFAPSLLWLMVGDRKTEAISRPLARLRKKGIDVVTGEVERIDPARREAVVAGSPLKGDFLVIALGADYAPDAIPGLASAGHNFYTLPGALSLSSAIERFEGGRVVVLTAAPAYRCPAAPYEAAMLIESALRKRKVRDKSSIEVFAAEAGPMGVAGPEVSKAVRTMVEGKGISYHPEHQVVRVDGESRRLVFANGVETTYDLLAYVPPHRAPRVVRDAGLAPEGGWMTVDRHTFETSFERVFAIGDVVSIPLKLGKPLPKAGVFAHGEAEVVAKNIARAVTGKGRAAAFDGSGECFIEIGGGKAGFGKGNFYAEPTPTVRLFGPGRSWHLAKVVFEKDWLRRWF